MKVQLTFDVEPGQDGVVDGRALAKGLIGTAFALLTPYVATCPACADDLFSVVANDALSDAHGESEERGKLPGVVLRPGLPDDDDVVFTHLERAAETTKALLEKAGKLCPLH